MKEFFMTQTYNIKRINQLDVRVQLPKKIEGHNEYLKSVPFEYDYATQSLVSKP